MSIITINITFLVLVNCLYYNTTRKRKPKYTDDQSHLSLDLMMSSTTIGKHSPHSPKKILPLIKKPLFVSREHLRADKQALVVNSSQSGVM